MRFRVLVVCTGNLCRSPAGELLLRDRVGDAPISVSSAGTSGVSGHEMDLASAYAVREVGLDPSQHVARRLTPAMVAEADLILTADSGHRSIIVQGDPLAFRRTFTIREFARLGAALPPLGAAPSVDLLRDRVAEVAQQRGWVEPGEPGADDIGDPIGAGLEVARSTVAALSTAVDGVVRTLGVGAHAAEQPS